MRYSDLNETGNPELADWWKSGKGRNAWTVFTSKNGSMSVYVRRNVFVPTVMEIASVSGVDGFGGARALYRDFCKDIPALAENILNPDLDQLLARLGWTHAYYDLAGCPTRINPAFMARFPNYAEARSAPQAVMQGR